MRIGRSFTLCRGGGEGCLLPGRGVSAPGERGVCSRGEGCLLPGRGVSAPRERVVCFRGVNRITHTSKTITLATRPVMIFIISQIVVVLVWWIGWVTGQLTGLMSVGVTFKTSSNVLVFPWGHSIVVLLHSLILSPEGPSCSRIRRMIAKSKTSK